MNDSQFLNFAEKIGNALRRNRAREDRLRAYGMFEEANYLYLESKHKAHQIFINEGEGMSPKEFDKRLRKLVGGRRMNVKLENLF